MPPRLLAILALLLVASPVVADELPGGRWTWDDGDVGPGPTTAEWPSEVENPIGSYFATTIGARPIGRSDPYWPEPCNVICGYEVYEADIGQPPESGVRTHSQGTCGVPGQGMRDVEYPWGYVRVWYCEC